jgi:hypothetical protein
MLNSPISPIAPAPTATGSPQECTKPGRWTVRKETCRPQTKKPKNRNQKVGVRKARASACFAVSSVPDAALGAGRSASGMASGIISSAAPAISHSVHSQPMPAMPKPATGTTRNCPKDEPAVPRPTARPRWFSGSSRVREAMITGIPAAETATPITRPAKKVNSGSPSDIAMPTMPSA